MNRGQLIRILKCVAAALVLAACTGGGAVLEVADDTIAVCAGVLPGKSEPYWFGVSVSNAGQSPITLKAVHLGEQDHILMDDAFAVPAVRLDDGTMLGDYVNLSGTHRGILSRSHFVQVWCRPGRCRLQPSQAGLVHETSAN